MSNLLNELLDSFEYANEAQKNYEERVAKSELIETEILKNETVKQLLLGAGVIVGNKLAKLYGDSIGFQDYKPASRPVFAHEINFDELDGNLDNPFKVGSEVVFIHDPEEDKQVVSHVVGSTIKVVGCTTVYDHSFFGFADEKYKNTIANILKVGDKVTHESFGREEFKVTLIVDGLVSVDDGVIEAPFNKFSLVKG